MRVEFLALAICMLPGAMAIPELEGGIGMLLLGDVGYSGSPINHWLAQDLIIDYFEIPMAQRQMPDKDLVRFTAIYFPRTMDRMTELYDMIVICEEEELFTRFTTPKQHTLMHDAVAKEGLALFTSLPHETFEFNAWASNMMGKLTPHDYGGGFIDLKGAFHVEILEGLPPIFTPFVGMGIEKVQGPRLGQLHPKVGSREWARVKPHNTPFFLSWEIGEKEARATTVANDLDEPWWGSTYRGAASPNPYAGDIFLNIVYWSVGKEPIIDIAIVHNVRVAYGTYLVEKSVVLALIEFVDNFGANVASLEEDLATISEGRAIVREMYFEQRYDEATAYLDQMLALMRAVDDQAVALKERAFLWIYLVEWLTVTATMMVVGFIVWTLMVKRRLYREVRVTRASL